MTGGEAVEVSGDYVYGIAATDAGWRIRSFAFSPAFDRGNADIPAFLPE